MSIELILPGSSVTQSGIYIAIHKGHRTPHELLFLAGERFPNCNICKRDVRYRLQQAAPHINDDEDFQEPTRTR